MTDTINEETVELVPALRVDRAILDAIEASTTELQATARTLVEQLKRANAAAERAKAVLDAHPSGEHDEFWKVMPSYETLFELVLRLRDMVEEWESDAADWSRFDDI